MAWPLVAALPLGAKKKDVVDSPKLYHEFRYKRATRMQDATQMLGIGPAGSKKKTQL